MQDPQDGSMFQMPNCSHCKFNENGFCSVYGKDILEAPIDIFDCPSFKKEGNEEPSEKPYFMSNPSWFVEKDGKFELTKEAPPDAVFSFFEWLGEHPS